VSPVVLGLLAVVGVFLALIVRVHLAVTWASLPALCYAALGLAAAGSGGFLLYRLRMRTTAVLCVSESGILYRDWRGREVSVSYEEIVELREQFPIVGRGIQWRLEYRQEPDEPPKSLVIPSIDDLDTDTIALRDAVVRRADLTGPERAGRAGWVWTRG